MLRPNDFRALALALPDVVEQEHQGHPDFRIGGKVFATLGGGEEWGMIRLPPSVQQTAILEHPESFEAIPGAWGKQGCTRVILAKATKSHVRTLLKEAWRARVS